MTQASAKRSRLMIGCASAALALGLVVGPAPARAQGIQAGSNVVFGAAEVDQSIANTTIVDVGTSTVVIDWDPFLDITGAAREFLPADATAIFQNGPGQGEFAVLNRILPDSFGNVAVINGTVISRLQDMSGGSTPGGFIAFYSPTGILVGSTASFDVGKLLLTTLDASDGNFGGFFEQGNTLQLAATQSASTARIRIEPGAQILATPENAFFAVVAADVEMFGTALVNGSHAYVAGQEVDLRFSNGLFDIFVRTGTAASGEVVTLDGTIGGPSSNGAGDNHVIYALARASQDPISMLFSGNLGFEPAQSAGVVNGEIVLAANHWVFDRFVAGDSISNGADATFSNREGLSNVRADIAIVDASVSSNLVAIGTHSTAASATGDDSTFAGSLVLVGSESAQLAASNGNALTVSGDVLVDSRDFGVDSSFLQDLTLANAQGGTALVEATSGGTIALGGNARVLADAVAGSDSFLRLAGSATGGTAAISGDGGTVAITGTAEISARGVGPSFENILIGATSRGGSAELLVQAGGTVSVGQGLTISTVASGAEGSLIDPSVGSDAFGGTSRLTVVDGDGTVTVGGLARLDASAFGGAANRTGAGPVGDAGEATIDLAGGGLVDLQGGLELAAIGRGGANAGGTGGTGLGGRATVLNQGGTLRIDGDFDAQARGFGGEGLTGGDALGGIAGARVTTGLIRILGGANVDSGTIAGDAAFGFGGAGGLGRGGYSFLQAEGTLTQTATLTVDGDAFVDATGVGGNGGVSNGQDIPAGRGGDGIGGQNSEPNQADTSLTSGSFVLAGGDRGNLSVSGLLTTTANGFGGDGGDGVGSVTGGRGGDGVGGMTQIGLALLGFDGSVGLGTAAFTGATASADGFGGNGGRSGQDFPTGQGGNGTGGEALLTAFAGDVTGDDMSLQAIGVGGQGRSAGTGIGGSAEVLGGRAGTLTLDFLRLDARGYGGFAGLGAGGDAIGGVAEMEIDAMNILITGDLLINADGFGGSSGDGAGGTGTGGEAYIGVINPASPGVLTVGGHTELFANGWGGNSETNFAAGNGVGGFAWIRVQGGGTKTFGSLQAGANGIGGTATEHQGGSGTGGIVRLNAVGVNSRLAVLRNVPGFVAVESVAGAAMLSADGIGRETVGGNGIGGTGRGGTVEIITGPRGTINLPVAILSDPDRAADTLSFAANGFGGNSPASGGSGGAAFGGTFRLLVDGGTLLSGAASPSITAQGGSSESPNLDIAGGNATGGVYSARVLGGGTLTIQTINNGGAAAVGGQGSGTGNGGNANAGTTLFEVIGSTANLAGHFTLSNNTLGGTGRLGGNAGGGSITFNAENASINLAPAAGLDGRLLVLSSMTGGAGLQAGGNAQGTAVAIDVTGSQIGGGRFLVEQTARGGAGLAEIGTGGNALGGAIALDVAGSTLTLTGGLGVSSFAFGGGGGANGLGGAANAGAVDAVFTTTTMTLLPAGGSQPRVVEVQSRASGGLAGAVGNAIANRAVLSLNNSTLAAEQVFVEASAEAGGLTGQTGGLATGGQARIALSGTSTLQASLIEILGNGITSAGGAARGGLSALQLASGTTGALDAAQLRMEANGSGATAGGLNNLAGRFSLEVAGGNVNLGSLAARAEGDGVTGTPLPSQLAAVGGNLNVAGTLAALTVDSLLARTEAGGVIGGTPAAGTTAGIVLETGGSLEVRGDGGTAGGLGGQSVQLLAGRSILIDGNVATRDGPVTVTANRGGGQPLPQPQSSAITMTQAGRIDAGSGTVAFRLLDGAGDPQRANGAITLANIAAGRIDVRNLGTSAGSDIGVLANGVLSASGSGRAIDLAALNGEVVNLAGDAGLLLTGGGHYAIFAATPTGSQIGSFANYARRYNVANAAAYDTLNLGGNFAAFRIVPTLTVSAADAARFYGDANPTFLTSISGFLPGDGPSDLTGAAQFTTLATQTSNVGAFAIQIAVGTLFSEQGYQLALGAPGILNITPRPITVTADDLARIYGNANPALTFTVGGLGLVNGDQLTGALATAADAATGVGSAAITQGTLAASSNYALTFNPGILSITPRPITIIADDLARIYGNANPALTFTVGGLGLVNGDQLTGALAAAADAATGVGSVAITQGTLAATANYALTFNPGILSITPRPITIIADDLARIYGNANPVLTFTVGGLGLVNGDQLTGALATAADATTGVGSVAITQGTLAATSNYALTFNPGILSITPRPITIIADTLAKFLGLRDPQLTFTVGGEGLVNGDQLSGSLLRDPGERLGTFAIRQGTLNAGQNYTTTFVGGELVIKGPPTPSEINNAIVLVGTGNGLDEVPGLFDGERNTRFGIDFPERPDAPLIVEDPLLDDPVASGGDASVYGGANVPPAGDK